ncbi:unnamed protein product, partial [marine sediment metagenome]
DIESGHKNNKGKKYGQDTFFTHDFALQNSIQKNMASKK